MDIKTIEYRRLISVGNYENLTIGATANLEDGEYIPDVLCTLRNMVDSWLEKEKARIQGTPYQERTIEDLDGQINRARIKWKLIEEFYKRNGIAIPDDVPF